VHVRPQGGEKKFGAKFTGKSCKCTPRESKSAFLRKLGEIWTVGVDNLVVSASVSRATTKKEKRS